jgi:putative DNA primase/helicase
MSKMGADDYAVSVAEPGPALQALPHAPLGFSIETDRQDLGILTDAATKVLIHANQAVPQFFRWAGTLARIEEDESGAPVAQLLTPDRLRYHLACLVRWTRRVGKGEARRPVVCFPPLAVIRSVLAQPPPPLPVLTGLTEVPTFTPAGQLHATPGFDVTTGRFYTPAAGFTLAPVPPHPTPADVSAARTLLLEDLLGDFPFIGAPDKAHALSLLFTVMARPLIRGPVPLLLIEKPGPGTGATLLVAALGRIALGRDAGAMTEGRGEEEWRKRVTAALTRAPALVVLDNLRQRLDSAALSSVLTVDPWEDRLLGRNNVMLRLPVRCAWVATANNPRLSPELTRRTVACRLDAKVDRPWERTGFRHADLLGWTEVHRERLVWATLVLIQRWLAAGRPAPPRPVFGMFEAWSDVIGGILAQADIPGFLDNRDALYERLDDETASLRVFLARWWAEHAATSQPVAVLLDLALHPEVMLDIDAKTDQGRRTRLGLLLKTIEDRVYHLDGARTLRVERVRAESATGGVLWRLVRGGRPDPSEGQSLLSARRESEVAPSPVSQRGRTTLQPSEGSDAEPEWVTEP